MTLRELKEALEGLPQLPSDTEVVVEDDGARLYNITYLDSEEEYSIVVIHLGIEVDK